MPNFSIASHLAHPFYHTPPLEGSRAVIQLNKKERITAIIASIFIGFLTAGIGGIAAFYAISGSFKTRHMAHLKSLQVPKVDLKPVLIVDLKPCPSPDPDEVASLAPSPDRSEECSGNPTGAPFSPQPSPLSFIGQDAGALFLKLEGTTAADLDNEPKKKAFLELVDQAVAEASRIVGDAAQVRGDALHSPLKERQKNPAIRQRLQEVAGLWRIKLKAGQVEAVFRTIAFAKNKPEITVRRDQKLALAVLVCLQVSHYLQTRRKHVV